MKWSGLCILSAMVMVLWCDSCDIRAIACVRGETVVADVKNRNQVHLWRL
jgi:hypothetical protein